MSNIANKLLKLTSLKKTVFSTNELMIIWGIEKKSVLLVVIARAVKDGYLLPIQRGLYLLKDTKADIFELACKMKKYSYISFETVLSQAGVNFQWYDSIFLASQRNGEVKNEYGQFCYRDLPDELLFNKKGIISKDNYFIAMPERALCDKIYKDGLIYFDDLSGLNKELVFDLAKMYNKRTEKDIKKLFYENK